MRSCSGAHVRDWLKVVVSDVDFDATSADLPPLDEPVTARRSARPPRSTVERVFAKAVHRDVGSTGPRRPMLELETRAGRRKS